MQELARVAVLTIGSRQLKGLHYLFTMYMLYERSQQEVVHFLNVQNTL
jgi:hypothetical protein